MGKRRSFSEISLLTYKISVMKLRICRFISDHLSSDKFAEINTAIKLDNVIYKHKSLIRRKLGNVDMTLQENKAINLSIAAPKVNGVIIKPGEVFSFWRLVGFCSEKKGYKRGLTIKGNASSDGIGGGMCQFTNLLHWLVLHSPLDIIERHHHNRFDLFPDFGRQVPFGCGTSIFYNYLDYRFKNNTGNEFQIFVTVDSEYLCGELRARYPLDKSYHIIERDNHFVCEEDGKYRINKVYRQTVNKGTGNILSEELIESSHAKVMYSNEN